MVFVNEVVYNNMHVFVNHLHFVFSPCLPVAQPLNGSGVVNGATGLKPSLPPGEWLKVWHCGLRLNTQFLSTLRYHYLDNALNFMGAYDLRISKVIL